MAVSSIGAVNRPYRQHHLPVLLPTCLSPSSRRRVGSLPLVSTRLLYRPSPLLSLLCSPLVVTPLPHHPPLMSSARRGRSRERSAVSSSSRLLAREASHSPEPLIVTVLSFIIYLIPIFIALGLWYYLQPLSHPSSSSTPSSLPSHPPLLRPGRLSPSRAHSTRTVNKPSVCITSRPIVTRFHLSSPCLGVGPPLPSFHILAISVVSRTYIISCPSSSPVSVSP